MNKDQKMEKFDHRKIGSEHHLFHFSEFAPGMPFWLPKGAQIRKRLENVIYRAHKVRGYSPVIAPKLMDVELWKTSGHYQNYSENMFFSEVEKRENALAPMNCPGHIINYKEDIRSYQHLPMRYFEFGQVHRNEHSGSLHGLFRVRTFQQDDLHSFVTPEQVKDEIIEHLSFIKSMLNVFDFDYSIDFSTKPSKAIGSDEVWEKSQGAIKNALEELGQEYHLNEGDGAFYGPKIDIKVKDRHGREWQLGTIQVDFNLPDRFELEYIDSDGKPQRPVMLHRAVMGSFERFLGILLEHYEGLLPVGLSAYQVAIVPISGESEIQKKYINEIKSRLVNELDADVIIYDDNNTLNKRIKTAEQDLNPIVMIIGDKEVEDNSVNLRHKVKQKRYQQSLNEFVSDLEKEMKIVI